MYSVKLWIRVLALNKYPKYTRQHQNVHKQNTVYINTALQLYTTSRSE